MSRSHRIKGAMRLCRRFRCSAGDRSFCQRRLWPQPLSFRCTRSFLNFLKERRKTKQKRTPHNSLFDIFSIWMSSWRDVSLKCDKLEKQNEDWDIWGHEALSGCKRQEGGGAGRVSAGHQTGRRALKLQHSQQKDKLNSGGKVWEVLLHLQSRYLTTSAPLQRKH